MEALQSVRRNATTLSEIVTKIRHPTRIVNITKSPVTESQEPKTLSKFILTEFSRFSRLVDTRHPAFLNYKQQNKNLIFSNNLTEQKMIKIIENQQNHADNLLFMYKYNSTL